MTCETEIFYYDENNNSFDDHDKAVRICIIEEDENGDFYETYMLKRDFYYNI